MKPSNGEVKSDRELTIANALMNVDTEKIASRDANILGTQMQAYNNARAKSEQMKVITRARLVDIIVLVIMLVVTIIFKLSIASVVMFIATEKIANIVIAIVNNKTASSSESKEYDRLMNDFSRVGKSLKNVNRSRRKDPK
jgi:hypothetical protein